MTDEQVKTTKLSLHLKYLIVISILFSCTVAGLSLYDQDLAIKGLSTAGLLTSIVLAVIAILITLWDVAGQRNNIFDVKNSVEELKNASGEISKLVNGLEMRNKEVLDTLTEYILHFQETSELSVYKITELSERFKKINISDDSIEEFQNVKNELESMNKLLKSKYIPIDKEELIHKPKPSTDFINFKHFYKINSGLDSTQTSYLTWKKLKEALDSVNTEDFKWKFKDLNDQADDDKDK